MEQKKTKTRYLVPTTQGAYLSVHTPSQTPAKRVLHWLLSQSHSPRLNQQTLKHIQQTSQCADAKAFINELLKQRVLELGHQPVHCPKAHMQKALPALLANLSDTQTAMLIDSRGLCIAYSGFKEQRVATLAALFGNITDSLYHAGRDVFELLDIQYGLSCFYDMASKKLFTFTPLFFGDTRFVVLAEGKKLFSENVFRDFIWVLWKRYMANGQIDLH